LNFSELGWWGRILSEMRTLILLTSILLFGACAATSTLEDKVAGTYALDEGGVIIMVLREREGIHAVENYTLGEFDGGQEPYKIFGKKVHVQKGKFFLGHDACVVFNIEPNGDSTPFAEIKSGKRAESPKELQHT
jgi:hypothetical protein